MYFHVVMNNLNSYLRSKSLRSVSIVCVVCDMYGVCVWYACGVWCVHMGVWHVYSM